MYENFKHYWGVNKVLLEKAGVEKDVAYVIWCAAVDSVADGFIKAVGRI